MDSCTDPLIDDETVDEWGTAARENETGNGNGEYGVRITTWRRRKRW